MADDVAEVGARPRRRLGDTAAHDLLAAQKTSLEMVVRGAPLPEVLAYLTGVVETHAPDDVAAAILLLDGEGRLRHGAAPSLPDSYNQAVDGLAAEAELGTCARAATIADAVVTTDIAACPRWAALKSLPLGLGLVAAWSQPILARDGRVLGTFGTYFRTRREPDATERRLVETLAHTAALAIERAEADRHRDLLVEELNHRVKNTLAVVQSIAAQTLRSQKTPEAFADAFVPRNSALARAHALLAATFWDGAALRQVVESALAPFGYGTSGAIEAKGPTVRVDPGGSVTLALVLHELATNAVKHGSLSVPEGRVEIAWEVGDAGRRVDLTWTETGGPPVSPPSSRGFGSRLIATSGRQFGRAPSVDYRPEGLACRLSFTAHSPV
jgi:two-component sensor histidine kinase